MYGRVVDYPELRDDAPTPEPEEPPKISMRSIGWKKRRDAAAAAKSKKRSESGQRMSRSVAALKPAQSTQFFQVLEEISL